MFNQEIIERVTRINELHCLGNNSIIPGQRTWANKNSQNSEERYKYPEIMAFRDIMALAIHIVTPTSQMVEQYNVLKTPNDNPERRKYIKFIQHNLQESLQAQLRGDWTLTNYFEERLISLLMIRHGLDYSNKSERKRLKAKINEAKQVAQELRQETINQLEEVIGDKRLLRLTELQEVNKHGSLFTLMRRAFLENTDDKARAEAIHMLALIDAALGIVLHREQAEGILNRIEEIMDNRVLNDEGEKMSGVKQKILYCIHKKNTLSPLFVAENIEEIYASYIGTNEINPDDILIAWHPFPCRRLKEENGEKVIEFMYSSRFKTSVSSLAKYLVKNGAEKPRDQNGIRLIIQNPEDAIALLTEIHKALTEAGLKPTIVTENEFTNYLFDGNTEIHYQYTNQKGEKKTVNVQLPPSTSAPTNQHSAWEPKTSEVFQCDVVVFINGKRKKFELRIVTPRQYLWDEYDQNGSHSNYVNKKKWANQTTEQERRNGYKPNNLFSQILPENYLRIIDAIDKETRGRSGIPRRRIKDLAEPTTVQALKQAIAVRIHGENRRRIAKQLVKKKKPDHPT